MERFVIALSRIMAVIAAAAIVVLMSAIVVDVTGRYFTNSSVPAMLEISEGSLVVAIFFALPWAGVTGAHVAVTIVSSRVGPGWNRVFDLVVWVFCSLVVAWLTVASGTRAMSATRLNETRMGLVQWPVWPLRWIIAFGFAVLLLVCLVNLVRSLRGRAVLGAETSEESVSTETVFPPVPTERE
ncbi:TRAP transporter small permease [Microbacterium sp. LRZ72]|uniref:TRAP transporter small permease n=1 Tax=Microbacterium sp. LRZ72 TaxID=2942481 RepID=UPI0029A7CE90|nr:TRAP transporter small permease [Microbacterium sp. LRZ72]MDX2376350.1 TRAP transporter small permease [Microbacterium sp. LRZ72]